MNVKTYTLREILDANSINFLNSVKGENNVQYIIANINLLNYMFKMHVFKTIPVSTLYKVINK